MVNYGIFITVHYFTLWGVHFIFSDEVTRDCVSGNVREGLERVCHTIPWSHDRHMTLDDPLWSQLDEFKTPEIEVKRFAFFFISK